MPKLYAKTLPTALDLVFKLLSKGGTVSRPKLGAVAPKTISCRMNFDTPTFPFHILLAQEGYLPNSLVHDFREETESTNVREGTFGHVFDRPKSVDLEVRKIAAAFFRDIYTLILEDALHASENLRQWGYFYQYKSNDEQIPSRFNKFEHGILQTIKTCVMKEPRSFNNCASFEEGVRRRNIRRSPGKKVSQALPNKI